MGKVCVAQNLEPRIPEECLVTKLAYHFEDGISQARLYGQIKTVGAMEALLGNYEQEGYYRNSRQQYDRPNTNREVQTRDQRQRVNYVRGGENNNNKNNNRNYQNQNYNNNYRRNNNSNQDRTRRGSFDNGRNYRNNNRYNEERRYQQRSRSSEDHSARNQERGREVRMDNRTNEEAAGTTQPQEIVGHQSLQ